LSVHSQEELDAIALQLNLRPRKRFGFKCPIEVMGKVMQETMMLKFQFNNRVALSSCNRPR
jgi:hypothetical protein